MPYARPTHVCLKHLRCTTPCVFIPEVPLCVMYFVCMYAICTHAVSMHAVCTYVISTKVVSTYTRSMYIIYMYAVFLLMLTVQKFEEAG